MGSSSSAIAATVSSTAAAPDMSIFISCIPAEGLIEMPPVSKVTPLPTRPRVGPSPTARVAQHDQLRLLRGSLADRDQAAHFLGGDLFAAEHVGSDRLVGGGDFASPPGQVGGRGDVGRQALQVAGAVLGLGADARRLGRGGDAGGPQQRQRLDRGRGRVVGIAAEEAVEAVAGEDRAGDERPRRSLRRRRTPAAPRRATSPPACAASCATSAAATRARSASISSRLPRPTTRTRRGPLGMQQRAAS